MGDDGVEILSLLSLSCLSLKLQDILRMEKNKRISPIVKVHSDLIASTIIRPSFRVIVHVLLVNLI